MFWVYLLCWLRNFSAWCKVSLYCDLIQELVNLDLSHVVFVFFVWFDRFEKHPKKYALVLPERNPENKRKRMREVLKPFQLTKCPPSHLSEELQSFMKAIVSACQYNPPRLKLNCRCCCKHMKYFKLFKILPSAFRQSLVSWILLWATTSSESTRTTCRLDDSLKRLLSRLVTY